jgi:energy-coupling factor transporter ATP-binding protein EcfA2
VSDEIKFLEKYAETLELKDKSRSVFCARFNKNNFCIGNNELAEKLYSDVTNPSQALQYHLKKVLDKLPLVGISHKNVGRGRPKNKEEPWKEAYEWLWDKPYSEYQEKYGTKPPIALDELCREASRRSYKQLTISKNPLMAEIGLTADQNNVVSLEIVERERISKKREDIQSSEQGSSFYQPTENEQGEKFPTTDRFLDEVIRDRKTKKSQGMRIAITGEAGAGKTTLLQSIGIYLEALNKELVPIWISLKQVTKNIDAYLVDEYLREIGTLPNLPIPSEFSESLNNLLKSGQVVLLLDGADESTERNILVNLGEQLNKPIFDNVQVILTCRINTWDTQWQSSFDVYRIIPFTYPVQVESFIDRFSWGDGENLAGSLKEVLRNESKSRLRDMVSNPLRLALLCYLWKNGEENLPDTRAELYRLMLEAFYKQKGMQSSKKLEDTLGKLAVAAIESEDYRYLLPENEVSKILGDVEDEGSLFWKAKKIGLLNQVGKSSKNPYENVYAFYHPSFQEYFAALKISHWDYFLPKNHIDKAIEGKKYYIFEHQWKDVILFWLGICDESKKHLKEEFLSKLLKFEDGCNNFYYFKAYFLAAEGITEFRGYPNNKTDEIISKIIKWRFGDFSIYTKKHRSFLHPIRQKSQNIILNYINRKKVVEELLHLIDTCSEPNICLDVAEILFKLDICNQMVVDKLIFLLHICCDQNIRFHIARTLVFLGVKNKGVMSAYNSKVRATLNPSSADILDRLVRNEFSEPTESDINWIQNLHYLDYIEDSINRLAIKDNLVKLIQIIQESQDWHIVSKACDLLVKLVNNKKKFGDIDEPLKKILPFLKKYLSSLKLHLSDELDSSRFEIQELYNTAWQISQNMSYLSFYSAWNSHSSYINNLNNKLIDFEAIQKELDHINEYPKIRCLVVDISHLENFTDQNLLSKRIWNGLQKQLPDFELPKINDIGDLEYELNKLQRNLGKTLAIALYGKSANDAIDQLCQNLAPIQIRLFTGGQTSEQLINDVKAWLRKINLEYN